MSDQLTPYFGKQALASQESSHDTLNEDNFRNWLVNEAGIGTYAHGRIHQEVGYSIYVSDLIHKRGHLVSSDILLMEEQETLSHSDPLTAPSRLGTLKAIEMLPAMGSATGEGELIAYYEYGVVSFRTNEAPRETRYDGEGKLIQEGWDRKRLVTHMLNALGAVGRYAVAVLLRDHLFRSKRGLHFLKTIIGEGTFNSENTNRISTDVEPILAADEDLSGAACGFWLSGDRMFATTGMTTCSCTSSSSFGRGFVSWNQAITFTEDRTPRPAWEGLWLPDYGIEGIHRFASEDRHNFGIICSDRDKEILFGELDSELEVDTRCGEEIPIEWSFETAQFAPAGLDKQSSINGLTLELVVSGASRDVRVLSRTDTDPTWRLWQRLPKLNKTVKDGQKMLVTESLGKPPTKHREATWIQVRVEGLGAAEIRLVELEASPSVSKAGRRSSYIVDLPEKDYFEINNSPASERWPQE